MTRSTGCREIAAPDPVQDATVRAWVLYPADAPAAEVRFGPYAATLAADAPPAGEALPVVALSHGNGGTPWSHRGLALHLVGAGCAVVMIEHPGNHRGDNRFGTPEGIIAPAMLGHRPRHVRLAVDAALADARVGPALRGDRYAIVGESIGAYTALAAAGGRAMTLPEDVPEAMRRAPDAATIARAFAVPTEADPRVRAAVLLVPAVGFYSAPDALAEVRVPLLVRTGARDPLCPAAQVRHALRSLPAGARVEHEDVPGAGHFSFQTPYPPALAAIPPAQDPPGFDRAAYQPVLYADVERFLRD